MAQIIPKTNTLGTANAAHLLRRAIFCPTKARINQYAALTPQQAVDLLFTPVAHDVQEPFAFDTGLPWITTPSNPTPAASALEDFEKSYNLRAWWIRKAEKTASIHAKLHFFLQSIFLIEIEDSAGGSTFSYDYITLMDYYSDKSIKSFAKKISRLNAMHYYLDNRLNTKTSPNENYAREFLELFTITKGPQDGAGSYTNYTEQDVQQAAKVLTGFTNIPVASRFSNLDAECAIPLGQKVFNNHSLGNKTFSAKFGNQTIIGATNSAEMDAELDAFIDMVFNQQATAKSYAKRLYRYFVKRDIDAEIEADIITPLANNILATNYDLKSTVKMLLKSLHFYDEDDSTVTDECIGAKIKSPLELSLMMLSQFHIQTPNPTTQTNASYRGFYYNFIWERMNLAGLALFMPIAVAGFPAIYEGPNYDKLWITTATLKTRYDLINNLLSGVNQYSVITKLDIVPFVQNSGNFSNPASSTTLVNEFLELCLVEIPSGERYTFFTQALLNGLSPINWQNEWNTYINTGNANAVKIALERFTKAVLRSPEYQIL